MKAIKIHDKDYYPVVERVKELRNKYPDYCINTEILNITDDSALVKAIIYIKPELIISTGHAYEEKGFSKINIKSMVENAETSAVGRALAFLGIGITDDIASADEMSGVDDVSDASYTQVSMIEELLPKANITEKIRQEIEIEFITFSKQRATKCIEYLKENAVDKKLDDQLTDRLKTSE